MRIEKQSLIGKGLPKIDASERATGRAVSRTSGTSRATSEESSGSTPPSVRYS